MAAVKLGSHYGCHETTSCRHTVFARLMVTDWALVLSQVAKIVLLALLSDVVCGVCLCVCMYVCMYV